MKFAGSSKAMLSSTTRSVKLVQAVVLGGTTVMVVLGLKSAPRKWEKDHYYIRSLAFFSSYQPLEDHYDWQ